MGGRGVLYACGLDGVEDGPPTLTYYDDRGSDSVIGALDKFFGEAAERAAAIDNDDDDEEGED